jgi:hypothetical protein
MEEWNLHTDGFLETMPKPSQFDEAIKKPNTKSDYTEEKNLLDLVQCIDDPLFFMKNFMKIQHVLKGSILFDPFPFQTKIIEGFHKNRNVIVMTGRQQGKCVSLDTNVSINGQQSTVEKFIPWTFKMRIVTFLERTLVKLS